MKKFVMAFLAASLPGFMTLPCYANTYFSSSVTAVGTYGDGSIYIFLSSAINEPGCQPNATRIDVQSTDPQIKQILAIAMMALATGKQITGAVNGCDPATGTPTFDTSTDSYIYVDQ